MLQAQALATKPNYYLSPYGEKGLSNDVATALFILTKL
jgi:hypothetical protein